MVGTTNISGPPRAPHQRYPPYSVGFVVTSGGLLERGGELDQIAAMVRAAARGNGSAVLITGQAGIGKTALIAEAGRLAAGTGMVVLSARGGELESEFPWGLARQLFEAIAARSRRESPIDPLRGAAGLAGHALGIGSTTAADASYATLHGLYWLVVNLTQEHPVLLALDDVHWADRPSLRFVAHLLPRIAELPVLLVLAGRPTTAETGPSADLLARLAVDPAVRKLEPAALTETASNTLVRELWASHASEDFGRACHEVSGGNPFLLRALIADLADENVTAGHTGAVHVRRMTPAAVTASVLVRLARLPRSALELARAVAVLSTDVELRQAASLASLDIDDAAGSAGSLIRAGILVGDHTLGFVHPLVRSAVHGDLSGPERGRWHYRAARMLAAERAPADEVAAHLIESHPNADGWTVECLRAAAEGVTSRGAPEIAIDYLRRALAEPPGDAVRAHVLFELGRIEARLDPVAAVPHLEQALATADDSTLRATITLALGEALTMSGRLAEAVRLLRRAVHEAPNGAGGELPAALLAALVGAARWDVDAQELRWRLVEDLNQRTAGGEAVHPLLHCQIAIEAAASGTDRAAAVRHARVALETAERQSTSSAALFPEAALVLVFADYSEEARHRIDDWLARARQQAWPLGVALGSACASLAALSLGDVGDAVADAQAAVAGTEIRLTPVTVAFLVEALIERGELRLAAQELAERGFDDELPPAWATTPLLLARGRLRAAIGDHRAAVDDLFTVGDRCETWGVTNPAMVPWRSNAALSLIRLGQHERAVALADAGVELARRWGAASAIGEAMRAAGIVHADSDRLGLLRAAVSTLEASPAKLQHAKAVVDLGVALRRAGKRIEARHHLSDGLDLAHRLGGLAVAERARQELVVAGGRPRRAAVRGRDALTPSELRVTQLASEGRTNRQIAEALFLTLRTVETHLTSSYSKLDITSRRQLPTALRPSEAT